MRNFLWSDCQSLEEQRVRVFRNWLLDPNGQCHEKWNNDRLVKYTIEFWIQPLLKLSGDESIPKLWSDGIIYFECQKREMANLHFSGTTVLSDQQARSQWLAPFELRCRYDESATPPQAVEIRLGRPDAKSQILRTPLGSSQTRIQRAKFIHVSRPEKNNEWAIVVYLDPYIAS